FTDWSWRNKAGLQQSVAQQLRQPLSILHIGLATWYMLDVLWIDQHDGAALFQDVEVGSVRSAVRAFQPARFLAPPSEPDVRVGPVSGSPRIHASCLRRGPGHRLPR